MNKIIKEIIPTIKYTGRYNWVLDLSRIDIKTRPKRNWVKYNIENTIRMFELKKLLNKK